MEKNNVVELIKELSYLEDEIESKIFRYNALLETLNAVRPDIGNKGVFKKKSLCKKVSN